MKLLFYGTPINACTVLKKLLTLTSDIVVITNPDAPSGRKNILKKSEVRQFAEANKLKTYTPTTLKGNTELSEELSKESFDLAIVVSYGKIIPLSFINLPKHKTINIHYSLLPKYRGASPIQAALLNMDNKTGTTIFELEESLDTGPIYTQIEYTIGRNDDYNTLEDKLTSISSQELISLIPNILNGTAVLTPQEHTRATTCKIIKKEAGKINWHSQTASQIEAQVKAYSRWPKSYCYLNNKKLTITKCSTLEKNTPPDQPGTILDDLVIICNQNTLLKIERLQIEGKKEVSAKDFLNGNSVIGEVLK